MSNGLVSGVDIARRHDDNVKELFGTGDDSSIYYDGNDLIIDPRDTAGTGTLVLTASVDGEPHLRLASGADHTASLVAGDVWFDGSNFKGYNGSATVTLDVAAASGGGWTDDGTTVRLTTATDHVAIGTASPNLSGSGDLTITGNFDLEGYGSIGNGTAVNAAITLAVDRDYSISSSGINASRLKVLGIVTLDGTNDNESRGLDVQGACIINSGNTHANVNTALFLEPTITETSGSVTTAATVRILSAPTEGDNNYALIIDSGDFRCDGDIIAEISGILTIRETTTPSARTNFGKVYTKTDNKLYFQDGAGVEHEIAVG